MKVTHLLNGEKININEFYKWIEALRSGKYKQTTGKLQDGVGYCCLGVACKVLIFEDLQRKDYLDRLVDTEPQFQVYAPEWLKQINEDVIARQKEESARSEDTIFAASLIHLNDERGFTFDTIADVLELIYVHGILEHTEEEDEAGEAEAVDKISIYL